MSSAAQAYLDRWSNPARNVMYVLAGIGFVVGGILLLSSFNEYDTATAYAMAVWGGVLMGLGIQLVLLAMLAHAIAITAQAAVAEILEVRQ